MTSAERLEQLCAIRDRSLTEEEQALIIRLKRVARDCERKRAKYWSDPEYRRKAIRRAVEGGHRKRIRDRQLWEESRRARAR